jgi:hypothetical protein
MFGKIISGCVRFRLGQEIQDKSIMDWLVEFVR